MSIARVASLAALAAILACPDGRAQSPPSNQLVVAVPVAVLQGLDKITGRIRTIEAPIDQKLRFGTLEIVARHCAKRPPEEPPESTAFLEIRDLKPDEEPKTAFIGWMFASSPAVSALEHPVYDVWVIDCKMAAPSPSSAR